MATLSVPPRIAFSDPISGSSLSVSQMMSLGKLTGPVGVAAAAGAGLATSTAKIVALPAGKSRLANTIAVKSLFILQTPIALLIFGKTLWIESFANRFTDEYDQNQRDGNGPERRQGQPQLIPVLHEKRLIDKLTPTRRRR